MISFIRPAEWLGEMIGNLLGTNCSLDSVEEKSTIVNVPVLVYGYIISFFISWETLIRIRGAKHFGKRRICDVVKDIGILEFCFCFKILAHWLSWLFLMKV